MQNEETRFSVARLNQLTKGDLEGRNTFLRLFATQTAGKELNDLEQALKCEVYMEVASIAHRMRASLKFFELTSEVKFLEELEIAASNGEVPLELNRHFAVFHSRLTNVASVLLSELQEHMGTTEGRNDPENIIS